MAYDPATRTLIAGTLLVTLWMAYTVFVSVVVTLSILGYWS
jgi:hypothetical protein